MDAVFGQAGMGSSSSSATCWCTLIPEGSGEYHQDTALELSTPLVNPSLPVLTDANLSGTICVHISSASLQRIQPVVPSHQRNTSAPCLDSENAFFSLVFSPTHLGYFLVTTELETGCALKATTSTPPEYAKSAFAPSLWKGEEVLEPPRVSDILESTQHH